MTSHPTTRHPIARALGSTGLIAFLALLLAGCAAGPAPAPSGPVSTADPVTRAAIERLGAAPCDSADQAQLQLATTDGLLCGALRVPVDRETSGSATTDLTVVLTEGDAPRGVLLLIGGGPGGASTWSVPTIRAIMPEVAAEYQLVALDLRGTGTGALDCPEVQREVGSSDVLAPSAAAIDACATAIGAWQDALSTEATVRDLDELRIALGATRWALDGTSYGTFVAARYAAAHPEAVRALVLDSVVPVEGVDPFLLSSFEALPGVLAERCAAESCETDPVEDLAEVLAGGYPALPLFNMLVAYSVAAPVFDGVIDALAAARAGEPSALDGLVAAMDAAAAAPLSTFSAGTHIATLCADTPMPWGEATDPAQRQAALATAIAGVDPERIRPFPSSLLAELGTAFSCLHWPASGGAPLDAALEAEALAEVPALLLTGELDLSTPFANALAMAQRFTSPQLVTIPGAGHAAQMTPGGIGVVTDFLLAAR